jgi:ribosomal protein S27AE
LRPPADSLSPHRTAVHSVRTAWQDPGRAPPELLRLEMDCVIDESGQWWTGEDFADLAEYIRLLTAGGYPADRVVQSVCTCGGTAHHLLADQAEGAAQRICATCGATAFIADSEELWGEAQPERWRCVCGHDTTELAVGFSLRGDGDVRWVTVGQRCIRCGVLGSFVDWKIDYGPSAQLVEQA